MRINFRIRIAIAQLFISIAIAQFFNSLYWPIFLTLWSAAPKTGAGGCPAREQERQWMSICLLLFSININDLSWRVGKFAIYLVWCMCMCVGVFSYQCPVRSSTSTRFIFVSLQGRVSGNGLEKISSFTRAAAGSQSGPLHSFLSLLWTCSSGLKEIRRQEHEDVQIETSSFLFWLIERDGGRWESLG